MSVAGTNSRIHTTPYPAGDLRYPTFRFTMGGVVVGDGSGGGVALTLRIGVAGGSPSGLVYGLRLIAIRAIGVGGNAGADIDNFRQASSQAVNAAIQVAFPPITVAGEDTYTSFLTRLLLGIPDTRTTNAEIIITWTTNTNTVSYRGYLEGFIWEPIALYEGGPLWPGEHPGHG